MRKRIIIGLMLVGFLLFVSCKSSLYDLCPNLFSKASAVKVETHLPSCHKIPEATKDKSSKQDCECPLAYQDYTLGSESVGKIQAPNHISLPSVLDTYSSLLTYGSPSLSKHQNRYAISFGANGHFLSTVRLLI